MKFISLFVLPMVLLAQQTYILHDLDTLAITQEGAVKAKLEWILKSIGIRITSKMVILSSKPFPKIKSGLVLTQWMIGLQHVFLK